MLVLIVLDRLLQHCSARHRVDAHTIRIALNLVRFA
jgi:hypothetical protein